MPPIPLLSVHEKLATELRHRPPATATDIAKLIRPKQAFWYQRVLARIGSLERHEGLPDGTIQLFLGQSPGIKGFGNAYVLLWDDGLAIHDGRNHNAAPGLVRHAEYLVGPITSAQIKQWMEACPDYNHPSAHRPAA
jgi:hypothetical protein